MVLFKELKRHPRPRHSYRCQPLLLAVAKLEVIHLHEAGGPERPAILHCKIALRRGWGETILTFCRRRLNSRCNQRFELRFHSTLEKSCVAGPQASGPSTEKTLHAPSPAPGDVRPVLGRWGWRPSESFYSLRSS